MLHLQVTSLERKKWKVQKVSVPYLHPSSAWRTAWNTENTLVKLHSHRVLVSTKHLLNTIKLFGRHNIVLFSRKILITLFLCFVAPQGAFSISEPNTRRTFISMFTGCSWNQHADLKLISPRVHVHFVCVRLLHACHGTKCNTPGLWDRNLSVV